MKQTLKYVLIALSSLTLTVGCIKETFPNTHVQKGQNGSNANPPAGLFTRIHLAQEMHAHRGGS